MYNNRVPGWMTGEELNLLYRLGKRFPEVVEIGSHRGRSTRAFLDAGAEVWAVDTWLDRDVPDRIATGEVIYLDFLEECGNDHRCHPMRMTSLEASRKFQPGSVDLVFIDGDHSYHSVKEDILAWRDKPRWVLCGHDYDPRPGFFPEVVMAVDELLGPVSKLGSIWLKSMDKSLEFYWDDKTLRYFSGGGNNGV